MQAQGTMILLGLLMILSWSPLAAQKCNHMQIKVCTSNSGFCICVPCKNCSIGEGLEPQCGSKVVMQDPRCIKCKSGETYSNKNMNIESCNPCHTCQGQKILRPCNATHDTICSEECEDGYEMSEVTDTCQQIETDDIWKKLNLKKQSKTINNNLTPNETKTTSKATVLIRKDNRSNDSSVEVYIIVPVSLVGLCAIVCCLCKIDWTLVKKRLKSIITSHSNQPSINEESRLTTAAIIQDDVLLNSISPEVEDLISSKISKRTRGVKNWRDIGHEYGVSRNDLDVMEEAYCKDNSSPGKCLLDKIFTQRPSEKINDFIQVMKKMKRNDVVDLIITKYT